MQVVCRGTTQVLPPLLLLSYCWARSLAGVLQRRVADDGVLAILVIVGVDANVLKTAVTLDQSSLPVGREGFSRHGHSCCGVVNGSHGSSSAASAMAPYLASCVDVRAADGGLGRERAFLVGELPSARG